MYGKGLMNVNIVNNFAFIGLLFTKLVCLPYNRGNRNEELVYLKAGDVDEKCMEGLIIYICTS
ncbi:hypothetical protein BACCIP111883_00219 [Sutcliffiella rhizosphaerae]|uniref:Uncharacterized protein n=1 Tax=Sutcliffiella rhizosphaerae TaxID=2880967 RepID=A0ABM8YHT3_9BACI|nr:hypothetical protein BACCIP111883_00219 [Sutcliffiella rhizosphaerae]